MPLALNVPRQLAAWDSSADDLTSKVVNGDEWHGVKFADCKFHAKEETVTFRA